MIYFRIAIHVEKTDRWQWKSTVLTSLNTVYGFLRMYERVEKQRIRIFFASSLPLLKEMLWRENSNQITNSLTAEQFYEAKGKIDRLGMIRLELELIDNAIVMNYVLQSNETDPLVTSGAEGTYDAPYRFTLPTTTREALVWARLLTSVQSGVLVP